MLLYTVSIFMRRERFDHLKEVICGNVEIVFLLLEGGG